jgi:membrane protein DedA with SNARE-associated domain
VTGTKTSSRRGLLLGLAGARTVLAIVAIPLAPVLFAEHFVVLVLLRPTKEVLLASGFLLREGDVNLAEVVAAAVPLAIVGVWLFYLLGRAYADEIQAGEGLPRWGEKLLPPERVRRLCRVLDEKGRPVVLVGRLAAFPSTLLGAAAGVSGMGARSFLAADAAGGVLSIAEVMVAGYVLGAAYKRAGPWLTVAGVVVLVGLLVGLGRWLRHEGDR